MPMTLIQWINLLLFNAAAWAVMGYFWSFWTHRSFKPFEWQAQRKKNKTPRSILQLERKSKDKNRFYSLWYLVQRIEQQQVPGALAAIGFPDTELVMLLHQMAPQRKFVIWAKPPNPNRTIVREDCQGNTYSQKETPEEWDFQKTAQLLASNSRIELLSGAFPQCMQNQQFAVVHLFTDTYSFTTQALEFFYKQLAPGGALWLHNYHYNLAEVVRAADHFSVGISEGMFPVPDLNGSVVWLKNKNQPFIKID